IPAPVWVVAADCAAAIISAEESSPRMRASGHRRRSPAVSWPGPQPRSTTVRGWSAPIRSTSSKNGRARSSPWCRYWAGSHLIIGLCRPGDEKEGPRTAARSGVRQLSGVTEHIEFSLAAVTPKEGNLADALVSLGSWRGRTDTVSMPCRCRTVARSPPRSAQAQTLVLGDRQQLVADGRSAGVIDRPIHQATGAGDLVMLVQGLPQADHGYQKSFVGAMGSSLRVTSRIAGFSTRCNNSIASLRISQ